MRENLPMHCELHNSTSYPKALMTVGRYEMQWRECRTGTIPSKQVTGSYRCRRIFQH